MVGALFPLHESASQMLTLYSYPTLFGVADNNGYGLKVFAFLRLAGVPFRHEHIFDASKAPSGQLAKSRPASTPASMASSPTSISKTSIPRSSNS